MQERGKQSEINPSHYTTPDYYRHYLKKNCHKDMNSKYRVSQTVYTRILKEFFNRIYSERIYTGGEFILPYNMGKLFIRKVETKVKLDSEGRLINHLPVDFGATRKLWRENPTAYENRVLIRHLNKHTNGYLYKFIYNKVTARFKNKSAYRFEATRTHKRELAKLAKSNKSNIDFLIKK